MKLPKIIQNHQDQIYLGLFIITLISSFLIMTYMLFWRW